MTSHAHENGGFHDISLVGLRHPIIFLIEKNYFHDFFHKTAL